jgi:polar amino acid transport system permease protein
MTNAMINLDGHLFLQRVFSPDGDFGRALWATIYISVLAQLGGIALGLVSSLAHLSRLRALRVLSATYVLMIRGTPLIVQIFFVYFGANLFLGFDLFPNSTSLFGLQVPGAVLAGIVALAVNEGAFMSEIIRAGIASIDRGQMESALSVGMTRGLAMRRIVLPQAARVIVPPLGNEFNGMMKNTSLLAFIGVYELFQDAQVRYSVDFKPVEYFGAVAVWYLLLTGVWSLIQRRIERRLAAGDQVAPQPGVRLRDRLLGRGLEASR